MPDDQEEVRGPAVRRRQLGRTLRDLRKAAGLSSLKAAHERTGFSTATLSRIEAAKQVILPRTVRSLCQAYGIGAPTLDHLLRLAEESEYRGWTLDFSDTVPDYAGRYVGEEDDAQEIWSYEQEYVQGPLQTPAYCRAVSAISDPDVTEEKLDRLVELRQARQQRLINRPSQQLIAVVNEGALHRQVGGRAVMNEQLRRLAELAELPNIDVLVLPFAAGAHPAMSGSFSMLHFPAEIGDPTIYVELDHGALYPDRPVDFDRRTWMFTELRRLALPTADSVALVSSLVRE